VQAASPDRAAAGWFGVQDEAGSPYRTVRASANSA